jgi:ATP-dependent Clp protease ATP-binding subunit ClpA
MSAIFSDDADSILSRAKSIAHEASHEYVGTDHIFAAICESRVVVLSEFLTIRGISIASVIEQVRAGGRGRLILASDLPFSPKAKDVVCRAILLTRIPPVTTERLLYAVLEAPCFGRGLDDTTSLLARLKIPLTEISSVLLQLEPPSCWPPDSPPLVTGRT